MSKTGRIVGVAVIAGSVVAGAWAWSHRTPAKHEPVPVAAAPQVAEAPAPTPAAPEPEPQPLPQPAAVDEAPAAPEAAASPIPQPPVTAQPIRPAQPPRKAAPAQPGDAQGPHPAVPVARFALSFVGADAGAEAVWASTINDPTVPAEARKDLIEDLNEDGFPDPKHVTAADLPLIMNRMDLIEEMAPDSMDDVNAAAFAEAYKDLVNMMAKAVR